MTAIKTILPAFIFLALWLCNCSRPGEEDRNYDESAALRRVLYVQNLYNHNPERDITGEIESVTDSMRTGGRGPYYYAAVNVLIDRLFSDGRFSEADSLAVRMLSEATADNDSLSTAMARRVRGQMLYKLSQPGRALTEMKKAATYITDPLNSNSQAGTALSIYEWLWIITREAGDTATMNQSAHAYAAITESASRAGILKDTTAHFPVTALALEAQAAFNRRNREEARHLLDSASRLLQPSQPSRAYEHLYEVRALVRAADNDAAGAVADVDTLLATHRGFPWFYLKDLSLKAKILNMAGRHAESAQAYAAYVSFHDSLSNVITDRRLHDLTVLYRSELETQHLKTQRIRLYSLGAGIILLLMLLILSLLYAANVRKKNRILVKRLKEEDAKNSGQYEKVSDATLSTLSPIERLDLFMARERPYTNPALGRKELGEFLSLSADQIGQLIKQEKGMSVKSYITGFRLEEARRLLGEDSGETITDMSVSLGFGTARTMQRAFKEKYDMSPTQYREAALKLMENSQS